MINNLLEQNSTRVGLDFTFDIELSDLAYYWKGVRYTTFNQIVPSKIVIQYGPVLQSATSFSTYEDRFKSFYVHLMAQAFVTFVNVDNAEVFSACGYRSIAKLASIEINYSDSRWLDKLISSSLALDTGLITVVNTWDRGFAYSRDLCRAIHSVDYVGQTDGCITFPVYNYFDGGMFEDYLTALTYLSIDRGQRSLAGLTYQVDFISND